METFDTIEAEYQGIAFHDSFERGKSSGTIRIGSQYLSFETETARVELPLQGLELKLGGASDRLVFFTHDSRPDWTVYSSDLKILQAPELTDLPDLAEQIRRIRRRRWRGRGVLLAVLGILLSCVVGLYLAKDVLVAWAVDGIPVSVEEKLGELAFEQLGAEKKFIEDDEILAQLESLVQPLIDAIPDKRYEFKFHIVEDSSLNAFALPGGHVTLHTGMVLSAEEAEEVLGVLAHELAHVTERHSMKQMVGSLGVMLLVQVLLGDVSAVLADNGGFLLTQKFSRDFERNADQVGWDCLLRASVKPAGMIKFFKRIKAEMDEAAGRLGELEERLNFLSTHPATDERIGRLEERWEALGKKEGYRELDQEFRALKAAIRARLAGQDKETDPEQDDEK